jgi:large subunit ribosomal protein L6
MSISTTSRIGRKPIAVPAGVEIKVQDTTISAKGPKGNLSFKIHPYVHISIEDKIIKISPNANSDSVITGASKKLYRSVAGTVRATISNMMQGVSEGFEKKLLLVGVGYRAQSKGKILSLSLGYSHPTDYDVPAGVVIETPTQTEVIIKGPSKELVGLVAAQIRSIRGPEPYKGKGVRYANEKIELKETKKK